MLTPVTLALKLNGGSCRGTLHAVRLGEARTGEGVAQIPIKKARGLLELIRPELSLAAGLCVVLGQMIVIAELPPVADLLLGFSWGFFLSAPAMILNDYFDITVDRVNMPHRPLASGLISLTSAAVYAAATTLVGFLASLLIGSTAVLLYALFWLAGLLYNWRLKESGLWGNLVVSSSVAVTFVLGGVVVGDPGSPALWALSLMVFLVNLGEEIAGDAVDMEGDGERGVQSVAILVGRGRALRISFTLFILAVAVSFLPVLLSVLGTSYLVIITVTDVLILHYGIRLLASETVDDGRNAIRRVYLSALCGLVLIIASRVLLG